MFNWSADGRTCSVTFTCAYDETHIETVDDIEVTPEVTTQPTCTEMGVTTYTVSVVFAGETYTATKEVIDVPVLSHTYEDGKCTVCDAKDHDYKPEISSPDTSDENGFILWSALLFTLSGALGITIYRKRKQVK